MSDPPIIGLTLNYRDTERTLRCVGSLLSNGAEHVVVWDNSDDDGVSAGLLSESLAGNKDVSLLHSLVNVGFAAAVNRGIVWISERFPDAWVALINNDAVFVPGALRHLSGALLNKPEAILSFSDIDHGGEVLGAVYYHRWLGLLTQRRIVGSVMYVSGCAMLIAPPRLEEKLFDESFFMYGEDMELGWRYAPTNDWCAYVPIVLVRHEGSASSRNGSDFYESRLVAAHLILAKSLSKNYLDYGVMLIGRCLVLTARALVRAFRNKSALPLRALLTGWKLSKGNDAMLARSMMASKSAELIRY